MTDAAYPVSQSALEATAKEYFDAIGASIDVSESRWEIELPRHVIIPFADDRVFNLQVGETNENRDDDPVLRPGSDFSQQLLKEASVLTPSGIVELESESGNVDFEPPPWVIQSEAEVASFSFNPYYDRNAVCTFVKIGVETVSQYQTEFLRAVAVDANTEEEVAALVSTLLHSYFDPDETPTMNSDGGQTDVSLSDTDQDLRSLSTRCQEIAVDQVTDHIEEIRKSASRSAATEFDGYRQYQEQRLEDVRGEIESLSETLQDLASKADHADSRQDRVEALQRRRELKEELDAKESERGEILTEKQRGFQSKRNSIFRRHALDIRVSVEAMTLVRYESGEADLELRQGGKTQSFTIPYAVGLGVSGTVHCPYCDVSLSENNPIVIGNSLRCQACLEP